MLLELLSFFGTILGFLFLTLSLASGLYYISELVEEHCEPTKRFLSRSIYGIICLFILLMAIDGFPIVLSCFSIFSYFIYLQNLKKFPFISLTGPIFVSSCILVVLNHYFWFKHFNNVEIPPQFRYDPHYIPKKRASFAEVASFFGICVWFIPFALFVSLSAGDQVLPTMTNGIGNTSGGSSNTTNNITARNTRVKNKKGIARVVIDSAREYFELLLNVFTGGGKRFNKITGSNANGRDNGILDGKYV
ncbi:related to Protein SVP26 [Saccharomycodes ludwigii]|uniref:Related to Protein SVP26 n=1 Tax=Saccharomycodes ludwigii TaxID=36035 RepID=A0A376B1K9_9ASCO|nr:hypothetical protein SCDLUD_004752 [Saccharomycodes ludwigii]KAH3899314.1 hypothetical protein SCDLUD_004752 [Saccharomycodes ludwigii]SSD58509.1 related to Protein SVP26 [Saccharomycodes ludwigii]